MDAALSSPLERRSLFGKGHVDITDNMRAFVQANYIRAKNDTFSAGPPPAVGAAWGGAIPNTPVAPNTAIPAGLQTLLDSRVRCRRRPRAGLRRTWQLNRGLDFLGQFGPTQRQRRLSDHGRLRRRVREPRLDLGSLLLERRDDRGRPSTTACPRSSAGRALSRRRTSVRTRRSCRRSAATTR